MSLTLSTLQTATSDNLIKLVERRHPAYKENLAHWEFLESSYQGGREWIEKNLFTYLKEGAREFNARKKRAYRFPHTKEVVNLVNKYVFKGAIDRNQQPPKSVVEFWKSATKSKRPIHDYMEALSVWSSVMGRIWVVVDNNYPAGIVTEEDRKNSNGRIYSYFIKPTEALDYAFDDDGELEWFLHLEEVRDDQNPLTSTGKSDFKYRLWTKTFTCLIKVEGKGTSKRAEVEADSIREYAIGIVPIFAGDHLFNDDAYKPSGLVEDTAYLDRAVTNYLSNLDVIIQDQTFSQLTIPYQGILPTEDDTDDEDDNQVKALLRMGTNRIFAYNGEGGVAPEFIAPDPKQAGIIIQAITRIVGEIYHSIGMAGERTKEDNATGIDNSSGVAKAYDFERLNAMLAAKARSLQYIEDNLVRLVLAWSGEVAELEDTQKLVSYPTTFDVRNLADEMDNAQRLSVMGAPVELRRLQMKRLAVKMFPQGADSDMRDIEKDITSNWLEEPEVPLNNTQSNPSLVGRVPGKKNSQGENNKGSVKAEDK